MRFIAKGPDIPNDLLDARDEGEVIFFCGAGVSRAKAGGPSFRELADRVVDSLGSSRRSPARQLLKISDQIQQIPGVGGIPSADRIFAMLEQEFPVAEVRRAVAAALRPQADADLGPHSSLLDLSRTPDGTVRLVTTNFDRVFEQVDPMLDAVVPPSLPDPARPGELRGILHLHGKVSKDYLDQDGPEFVLSSADFGRAYLADGWATTFMRSLMNRYRIVFVGYSADDPPIQYLLEALQPNIAAGRMYAFQEGDVSSATGLWRHKGVSAIPFDGFETLWQTLAAWAARARDPEAWRKNVVDMATRSPRDLQPYERGQVAHIVNSPIGARVFASNNPAPPAEWLCVFDPDVRYDRRLQVTWGDTEPNRFDPFDCYGLDDEIPPDREKEKFGRTIPPANSWSAFDALPNERPGLRTQFQQSMRGPAAISPLALPERLRCIARWLGKVAADPVAVWWASGQSALHAEIIFQVQHAILQGDVPPSLRTAWRLIFAALEEHRKHAHDRYELRRAIDIEGWSHLNVMKLVEIERPRLTTQRVTTAPIFGGQETRRPVDAMVSYPDYDGALKVPDQYLPDYIDGTRRNLLLATRMEEEIDGIGLIDIDPLHPFEFGPGEVVAESPDLSSVMAKLATLVRRLSEIAPAAASAEVSSWSHVAGKPFRNLRVWSASQPTLTDATQAAAIILSLKGEAWEPRLERDILTAIGARWDELTEEARIGIEAVALAGPEPWPDVDPKWFESYRAHSVLRWLFWIKRSGLHLSVDLDAEIARLKEVHPDWDAQDAAYQLDRSPSRGGWVGTDKEHSALLDVPLDALLENAKALSGRGRDFLMEARPFRGLVETRPVKAFAALRRARDEDWRSAWRDLLGADARAKDSARFRCYLARRIGALPNTILTTNLWTMVQWFVTHAKPVFEADRNLYLCTWHLLAATIARQPEAAKSAVVSQSHHDWVIEALNSPAGRLANVLFDEVSWEEGADEPNESLIDRSALLLRLPSEPRSHAAVMLAMRTSWFYIHERRWTETHLLPIIEEVHDPKVTDAARHGFLRQQIFSSEDLFRRLRPLLMAMLAEGDSRASRRDNKLESLILAGWYRKAADGSRLVDSEDLREALVTTGEPQRLGILRIVVTKYKETREYSAETAEFLRSVWPRQLAARSPEAASALADIAFCAGERMPEITAVILPLLESTRRSGNVLSNAWRITDDQIAKFPKEHLTIFFAMLPEDATLWSWEVSRVIEELSGAPELRNDPRLSELRRRLVRL